MTNHLGTCFKNSKSLNLCWVILKLIMCRVKSLKHCGQKMYEKINDFSERSPRAAHNVKWNKNWKNIKCTQSMWECEIILTKVHSVSNIFFVSLHPYPCVPPLFFEWNWCVLFIKYFWTQNLQRMSGAGVWWRLGLSVFTHWNGRCWLSG